MNQRRIWFFFSMVVVLFPARSRACTCMGMHTVSTQREWVAFYSEGKQASKIIFEGLVEKQELGTGNLAMPATAGSMTTRGGHRLVTVKVLRVYRGKVSGTVVVITGLGGGDCGFDFETGKQFLIYAEKVGGDTLLTSICSGTSAIERAGTALRLLRGEPPTADDLLDPKSYYEKVEPSLTGVACGRVTSDQGAPLGGMLVKLSQVRDEPFLLKTRDHGAVSGPDGSFCVANILPSRYVLTAEKIDFDHNTRWMGYYPSVTTHNDAKVLEISARTTLHDLDFSLRNQPLYNVSVLLKAADGSQLPLSDIRISIDSPDRDDLSYHSQEGLWKGRYTTGLLPAGKYMVRSFPSPLASKTTQAEIAKWKMLEQEVEIKSGDDIVLTLEPAK